MQPEPEVRSDIRIRADQTVVPSRGKSGLVAYGVFFTGVSLLFLSVLGEKTLGWSAVASEFTRDFGLLLSAIMVGTIIHEKLLRDDLVREIGAELENRLATRIPHDLVRVIGNSLTHRLAERVPTLGETSRSVADEVHKLFTESPPQMTGLRLLSEVRRGLPGYYQWVNEHRAQVLFFGGRSVLHRIDADIRDNGGSSAEDILLRRLKEGSKITVLLLDPRTELLDRLASEEGQTSNSMLGDIAISIGVARRLFNLVHERYRDLLRGSELTIRVYDRVPYFAYHRQDDDVIVGFYFLSTKGYSSAAYELIDNQTKQVFGDHFAAMFADAADTSIVDYDGARGRPTLNNELIKQLLDVLTLRLGADEVDRLVNRK